MLQEAFQLSSKNWVKQDNHLDFMNKWMPPLKEYGFPDMKNTWATDIVK